MTSNISAPVQCSISGDPVRGLVHFTNGETEALQTHIHSKGPLNRLRAPQADFLSQGLYIEGTHNRLAGGLSQARTQMCELLQIKDVRSPLLDFMDEAQHNPGTHPPKHLGKRSPG